MEFCTGNFFKGEKHTTAKINEGMIWMKVFEFPSGTKNKKKWIYENAGNKVVDTLKFYIYEENGKHRFLPENGKIEEGSVYIEPYVYGFTPITVKLDSRDISKKVNDGYGNVKKSFKESKMERKTMKKLNITKERFEKSNYFQRKYGKLEYVSESGKLFKTSKGNVLKFNEGFMSNMGKDGQRLYSIIYRADGWDGSIQEYGKSKEDAIQTAIAKGKLDGDEDIVKVVDLGEKGEYLESSRKLAKKDAKGKNELTEDAILDAIPVDARDGLIDINEPDGSFGQYTWYVRFAPFSDEEAKEAATGIKNVTGSRTQVAGFGKEIYVLIMNYPSRPISESKKLVKEGAGAGYTVEIKNLKIGDLIGFEWKSEKNGDGEYVEAKFKVVPGTYEIEASDYYNDFFWQEHEIGITPDAVIDDGVITVEYNPDYYKKDYEDPDFKDYDGRGLDIEHELRRQIQGEYDISFSYGHGWVHADLPDTMDLTDVDVNGKEVYWMITRLQMEAGDLADAVNSGFQSTFDQGEEDENGEPMDESYDPKGDDGRKKIMDALEEFRQVLWDDTKVDDEDEHNLRRSLYQDVDNAISQAIQKYFKYSRM